jgi:hypothetical protein
METSDLQVCVVGRRCIQPEGYFAANEKGLSATDRPRLLHLEDEALRRMTAI